MFLALGSDGRTATKGPSKMGIVVLLLILALLFGGVGLFVEGLMWLLIISLVLLVVGAVFGSRTRGGRAV